MATLPDEKAARELGDKRFGQKVFGPQDALTPNVTDLLDAFDTARLAGKKPPISRVDAEIPKRLVWNLTATTGYGCQALGIVPTGKKLGIQNEIPADFDPKPGTDPTR